MDGVSIGIKKSRCLIERPFKPSASNSEFVHRGAHVLSISRSNFAYPTPSLVIMWVRPWQYRARYLVGIYPTTTTKKGFLLLLPAGSRFTDRVFIASRSLREKILELFTCHTVSGGRVKAAITPTTEELEKIGHQLRVDQNNCGALEPILQYCFNGHEVGATVTHPFFGIIRTLATKAPVCGLVKPHIRDIVDKVVGGGTCSVFDYDKLHTHSPVLARFMKAGMDQLPSHTRNLLRELSLRADKAFSSGNEVDEVSCSS